MDNTEKGIQRQFAKVKTLADDHATLTSASATIDQDILLRIRKCLERANHPNTAEAEVQAALKLSNRLMQLHNIEHADIIAADCATSEPSKLSGQSTVRILYKDSSKKIIYETWAGRVAYAMNIFFDCKSYSTQSSSYIDWTFYGIATNTVAAAMAFEMVHNLIQDWSMRKRKGNKNSYRLGVADGLRKIATKEQKEEERGAREREAADLAAREQEEQAQRQRELDTLLQGNTGEDIENNCNVDNATSNTDADDCPKPIKRESIHVKIEDDIEEVEPQHNFDFIDTGSENKQMAADRDSHDFQGLNGVAASISAAYPDDDDYDSDFDHDNLYDDLPNDSFDWHSPTFYDDDEVPVNLTADFEDELRRHMPQKVKREDLEEDDEKHEVKPTLDFDTLKHESDKLSGLTEWRSPGALILFRQNARKIAEDYLKAQAVKLRKGRKRDYAIRDWDAYDDGMKDSKKIDVKRRRIEGSKEVVKQE